MLQGEAKKKDVGRHYEVMGSQDESQGLLSSAPTFI